MNLNSAIAFIEAIISKETANGDSSFALSLDSQLEEIEDGGFKPIYRADILYLVCGRFEDTISDALISLAKELKQVGYIEQKGRADE